nr:hypothetical protein [Tanacetum cinerariifolium]
MSDSDESGVTYTKAPPLPDYVPGPEHADDEIVAEDQPYVEDASPTAQVPEYVPESDLEAYPEEDNDEDPEEDPAPSAEETEPFETDESAATPPPYPAYRMTARISILAPVPIPAWSDSEVVRLLAMSSPPSSPLSPLSLPPPHISFPPLPPILSPPLHVLSPAPPPSPIRSLGYRAAMIRLSDAPSSGIPPPLLISAPTSSPPLQLPFASRREDRPEVTLPPQNRLGITLGPRYEVGESSSAAAARPVGGLRADYGFVATMDREIRCDPEREVGYGITESWDEIVETLQGAPVSTDTELGGYMREFETRVRRDTDEIYSRLDDEQSERQLLVGRLNMLFRDRRAHAYTHHQMETEARLSREAWVRSMDASDLARDEIVTSEMLRADHIRSAEIRGLRTADRTRQQQLIQTLTVMQTLQGQKKMAPKRTTRSTADQETTNTTSVTNAQLQAMIEQGVAAALAARGALRSTNGDDSHNSGMGVRRTERATRECTYIDFLNNCAIENQVKFATCTLHSFALTWWNTHVKTVGHDAAYGMPWKTLMKMMTDKYCPRNEIKKLEMEIWDLKRSLDMIHGSVVASKPKTMQEAVEIATELMDIKFALLLNVKQRVKGSLRIPQEALRTN